MGQKKEEKNLGKLSGAAAAVGTRDGRVDDSIHTSGGYGVPRNHKPAVSEWNNMKGIRSPGPGT